LAVLVVAIGTALSVVVLVITLGDAGRATAVAQPRPTSTPDAPGIALASSPKLDLPDPFLLSADGEYYLYLSTAFADSTHSNVPMLVGTPGHWSSVRDALPKVPSWALSTSTGAYTWDPYVVHLGDRYVMYFASQLRDFSPATHCIGIALSSSPAGPFVPTGTRPLVCQAELGGDIDAQLFSDPHGPNGAAHPNYLVWKSDNNDLAGSGPTTIWAAAMSDDGLTIEGPATKIFVPGEAWEQPVLEAPQMTTAPDGTDWLFYSGGGGFYSADYAVGAARCAGPLGGCHDVSAGPLISSNAQGSGPGEETIYVGDDHSTWVLYNPWHSHEMAALLRPAEAARIGWNSLGPYVAEAGTFPSP